MATNLNLAISFGFKLMKRLLNVVCVIFQENGMTPLMKAARDGQVAIVEWLLQMGVALDETNRVSTNLVVPQNPAYKPSGYTIPRYNPLMI